MHLPLFLPFEQASPPELTVVAKNAALVDDGVNHSILHYMHCMRLMLGGIFQDSTHRREPSAFLLSWQRETLPHRLSLRS